jgi:hypothetical protein
MTQLPNLFGDFAADLFEVGHIIESGALVFGVAVPADTEGHFPLYLSLSRMAFSFPMTGLTLDPLKIKRNFIYGGILSYLSITRGVADQALLLRIFGGSSDGLGGLGMFALQPVSVIYLMTSLTRDGPGKRARFRNSGKHLLFR